MGVATDMFKYFSGVTFQRTALNVAKTNGRYTQMNALENKPNN